MPTDPRNLLTTKQAAERLHVTDETVRRWAKAGRLRHVVTPSGRLLFDGADLTAAYRVVDTATAEQGSAA